MRGELEDLDLLIVGAGPVGCVIAERAATQLGWRCLVLDKRNHIAGNCYDCYNEDGVLIHQYGPHYFRTNDQSLLNYLSGFTDWIPGNYIVKSYTQGKYYPFPINLITLEQFFQRPFTAKEAEVFLDEIREKIETPTNSEEAVLAKVGRKLYEAFYLGYTLKQWNLHPRHLDASVCNRIPVRFNRDCRYVSHQFQVMPAEGFTAMFGKMLDHPLISVRLNTNYQDLKSAIKPRQATVYCGPVDEYFNKKLGPLPWRSLHFEFETHNQPYVQQWPQISYPDDFEYTRTFESKHVTGQQHPKTVISYEYPKSAGDPYYPIPSKETSQLYEAYKGLAEKETLENRVFFAGRLAQYTYINTDEAIQTGLNTFKSLERLHHG